jgi:hypothetical protein
MEGQGRVVLDSSREMKGAGRGEGARRMRASALLKEDAEINEGTCVSNGCEKGSGHAITQEKSKILFGPNGPSGRTPSTRSLNNLGASSRQAQHKSVTTVETFCFSLRNLPFGFLAQHIRSILIWIGFVMWLNHLLTFVA